jgi:uncharacterized protein YdaU (DUF1376 family)
VGQHGRRGQGQSLQDREADELDGLNYYPFHIGDYVSATRHLSWEEDAAFRRLLDTYYTTEKPIPADLRAACRLVMAQTDSQREAVRVVLDEFFTPTDAGWINKRADSEIDAMREKQQKQRDKANKRWHMPKPAPGNAAASKSDAAASKSDADAMPPTPTPTPTPFRKEAPRKRAAAPTCPDDVGEQVWCDWLQLRKSKKAAVSETLVTEARAEADKAGLTLEAFLRAWCLRGSQGFSADWLKPHERGTGPPAETSFTRDRKAQAAAWMGSSAPKRTTEIIEMESADGDGSALR